MTREEAIKVLNGILHLNYRNFWDEECDEAIDIAIEALSEDKTDRMTREEAIADIKNNIKPVVGGKSLDMAIEALQADTVQDGRNNIKRYPNCQMRTSLGNCDAIGGFCTSINAPICDAFHKLVEVVQGEWYEDFVNANHGLAKEICELKAQIESADVVEVVRCGECKYKRLYDEGETKYYYCALEDRPNRNWSVDDTDYCSWGGESDEESEEEE